MKKIINRKLYDTDTAILLGEYDNELDDLSRIQEKLYQKKNGEYFLFGEGGPRTEYCSMDGLSCGWGFEIIPFSKNEAMDWSEENLSVDEYIRIFGNPGE